MIEMGERETVEALGATVMKVLAGTGLHWRRSERAAAKGRSSEDTARDGWKAVQRLSRYAKPGRAGTTELPQRAAALTRSAQASNTFLFLFTLSSRFT
jgi:hypothetical protein